jgi:hypothetical protein
LGAPISGRLPSGCSSFRYESDLIVFCVADDLFDFFLESRWQGEASLLCRIMSLVSFPRTISRRLEWYTRPSCRRAYHDYIRGQTEAGMLPLLSPFRIAHVALSSGHTYKVNLKNHKVIGVVSSRGSRELVIYFRSQGMSRSSHNAPFNPSDTKKTAQRYARLGCLRPSWSLHIRSTESIGPRKR